MFSLLPKAVAQAIGEAIAVGISYGIGVPARDGELGGRAGC